MQSIRTQQEPKLSRFTATRGVHSGQDRNQKKKKNCDVIKSLCDVVCSVR